MLTEFTPSSKFVPADLDASRWEVLRPLYADLIARDLHCINCLNSLLMDRSELDAAASEAGNTLYINMTRRTDDAGANAAYERFIEHVLPRLKEAAFELDKKIAACPFTSDLNARRFEVYLRDIKTSVDLFRQENIPLETDLAKLEQEYSQICGAMTVQFRGQDRPLPRMQVFQEDTDRATREEAWRAVAERRYSDRERLDAIYQKMIDLRGSVSRNAGLKDFREWSWKAKRRFDYTPQACDQFAQGVQSAVTPAVRRLTAARAKSLGLSSVRPWDAAVDVKGRPPLKPFESADELVERSSRVFRRMDPSLGEIFEFLRRPKEGIDTCLDLESRKGKAPGGYQSMRDRKRVPFIFMNASGLQRDVETMVHEAGHAFHSLLARSEPLYHYRSEIPLEFCEVASMSMELLMHPFIDEYYSSRDDADRARRNHLEGIGASLCAIAMVDQFQHWVYCTPRSQTGPDACHMKWAELTDRYGPGQDWTGLEDFKRANWHRILHLFCVPFYYIEYGIAQLGAIQMWMKYREDPHAAIESYKRALSLGGSRPLPELFAAAGLEFDLSPTMISRLWNEVESELARLPQ